VGVEPELRTRVHRRLGRQLGKFAPRIERLSVRFDDVNGPRGGMDIACTIKAVVSGLPSLVVTELASDPGDAFDRAGQRLERVVRRAIGRARQTGRLRRLQEPEHEAAEQGVPAKQAPAAPASTAARNRKKHAPKANVALEGSARSRPSRKTTRGSANRAKHGNKLARRERRRLASPKSRRGQAGKTR
jgi:ribosome-associated translation inhibitor RaiA